MEDDLGLDDVIMQQSENLNKNKPTKASKAPKVANKGIIFDSANHELAKTKKQHDEGQPLTKENKVQ